MASGNDERSGTVHLATRFQELYAAFREKRNAFFALAPKKNEGEGNPQFMVRLQQWYAPHKRDGSEIDRAADAARYAGKTCMVYAFTDWEQFRGQCAAYLLQQGYAELTNVYLFTAPMDALNWKTMKDLDVSIDHWSEVAALNDNAGDGLYPKFLSTYMEIQRRLLVGEITEDPYPTEDMRIVRIMIMVPHREEPLLENKKRMEKLMWC
jgi:hypothetical protein